jgi:hypothetical protein
VSRRIPARLAHNPLEAHLWYPVGQQGAER